VSNAPSPRPESARIESNFDFDTPQIMRGTVSAEAVLDGYRPVVARGYGLVVGLNGTGSRDIPPQVRAHMIQEMARHGIGSERAGWGDLKPEQMLDSEDTAVVVVEAVIPPGAVGRKIYRNQIVPGTKFDVRVYADPRTGTRSLEGGRLYTTELRPGPLTVGRGQTFAIARASGQIFVNPFAEPGALERDTVTRTTGMILNGGEVTRDMPLKLRLMNPSHTRASILQNSINARFPRERGQQDDTARGESDSSIRITVPPSFRDQTAEFITLLEHMTIRLADPESVAMSVRRSLLSDPSVAREASWRWQALGDRVLPIIRDLYDYPEELPRLAALRAGAKLDDALVVEHLIDLAHQGSTDIRAESIELLSDMALNPQIDHALRDLLNDQSVDVRLAAYEALSKRGDPRLRRLAVDNNKFQIDIVRSEKPMIYVTQFGQPRIVIFGEELSIERPVFVQAWSNRLMVKDIDGADELEVYYRQNPMDINGSIHRVDAELPEFVRFLGHTSTVERPEAGLGLSYGETVGALFQIWSNQYIIADFKADQDRILAAIMREEQESTVVDRPEFSDPESDWMEMDPSEFRMPMSDLDRLSPGDVPGAHAPVPRSGRSDSSQ
jgi:flagellar basal body P-ring protein FlgI